MAIAFLLAAVGVLSYSLMSKNTYPAPFGVALGGAALATFLGVSLWITILLVVIVGVTGYLLIHGGVRRWLSATVGGTAAAVVLAIAAAVTLTGGAASPASANATNTPSQAEIAELTIDTVNYTCKTDINGLVAWNIATLPKTGQPDLRKWSDSPSTPFKATDPAGMLAEVKQHVCEDPVFGSMVENYFANLKLGTFAVRSKNKWLDNFAGDPTTVIARQAGYYLPLRNVAPKDVTATQAADAAAKNKAWQGLAAKANTLLSKFHLDGVKALQSILNYHVAGGNLVAGIPVIELNSNQEDLPALILGLDEKAIGCEALMGFNKADERLEEFSCASQPSPGPSTPGTPTHPGTTPPGGCTSGCVTTPPTTSTPHPSPSCSQYTSPQGTCYGSKKPAPQPSGVGNPTMTNPGTVNNTPPPPKPTPLQPTSGSGGGQPTAPGASPVPTYSPGPTVTGAPGPSQAPTTMPCPPGMTC